jgi:hypothetical protein
MENPCYKCGQVLEEGRPFCPHCAAPQIRVVMAEPSPVAPAERVAAIGIADLPASETVPVLAVPVSWSQALKPCALAALVALVLMFLRLTPAVAMFSTGFLAVVFYRQGHPNIRMKPTAGARLGAFGGLLCFGITTLLLALLATVPDLRAKIHDQMVGFLEQAAASNASDPQVQAFLRETKTPEGFVVTLLFIGIASLVVYVLLGALGGALGGAIFGRRKRE